MEKVNRALMTLGRNNEKRKMREIIKTKLRKATIKPEKMLNLTTPVLR